MLQNYTSQISLGVDKYIVNNQGIIKNIDNNECYFQAEDLTEPQKNHFIIYDEDFNDNFQIDLAKNKETIKETYIVLSVLGENTQGQEFVHGWTFVPLINQNVNFNQKNGYFYKF
ncbi:hypothetical protein PPERSA_08486 [Pseudocohnilembus persalinus]|uniref:Uncharacterized protein n=1 Tax=Pseudocohnilembus persalinus TaxID=266149 RepID=A0A0V0R6I6_PSEPJ|nr:hypothetical protein PPERSA_08486 [Pseudocohnilembus persalinus]|eukprot:KRX10083.1 hypothetical protein PPERSA_08486 [Pseudocohnilembus persalinus]